MLSDKFWAEYKELGQLDFTEVTGQWIKDRFAPEHQRLALETVSESIRATLPPEEDTDEEILTAKEFCDKVGEPPPMIAEGMLAPNTLMLVTGKPKAGKSFFMLQVADDVANGRPMLGKFDVPQAGPVMYFALEGPAYKWRHRIMQKGMYDRDSPVYIFTKRRDFSTREGVEWLIRTAAKINPVLIVIDTVRQGLNLESTNDADKVNMRMRPLLDAVQQRGSLTLPDGCCIILVHHNNKNALAEGGDKISGSNALQSNADGYIIIDDHKRIAGGNLQGKAQCESRIDTIPDFIWEMDTDTFEVRILDDDDVAAVQAEERIARMERNFPLIAHAISQFDGGATFAEICTKSGLNRSMLQKIIPIMLDKGVILVEGTRPSKRGAPSTVYINNSASSIYIGEQLNTPSENLIPLAKNGTERPLVTAFFDGTAESTKPAPETPTEEDWNE